MSDQDIDPGEPIRELATLEEEPGRGFLDRIRGGILRRVAGVQALEFALDMVLGFLREMGDLLFGGATSSSTRSRNE